MNKDKAYVDDVLHAMKDVVAYLGDASIETFAGDQMRLDAIHRKLEIMGEATKRLSAALRDNHPEIPWKKMAGMRDKLIHGYDEIDPDEVYNAVAVVIPPLIPKLATILQAMADPD